jgi:CRISPR/Cas system-associated endonuclease Cas1
LADQSIDRRKGETWGQVLKYVPVGGVSCLMLKPGTRVSHAAVALASRVGCLLVWVGEAGVRLNSAGQPGGARADRLLYQAKLALDVAARLKVVRKMYELRFKERPPDKTEEFPLKWMARNWFHSSRFQKKIREKIPSQKWLKTSVE